MLITKREEVTKQGFCKILWRKLRPRESLLLEFIHLSGWGGGECLFEFDWEEEGVGAYSRLLLFCFKKYLPWLSFYSALQRHYMYVQLYMYFEH